MSKKELKKYGKQFSDYLDNIGHEYSTIEWAIDQFYIATFGSYNEKQSRELLEYWQNN